MTNTGRTFASDARRAALLALLVTGGCAQLRPSHTTTALREGEPAVRTYDGERAELDALDGRATSLEREGGCPVCSW